MDPLVALRSAIAAKASPELRDNNGPVTDISRATMLAFPPVPGVSSEPFSLDLEQPTRYTVDSNALTMRTVYNCWDTRELTITDYIAVSAERDIVNLKFVERTDLLTWLEGASSQADGLAEPAVAGPTVEEFVDPALQEVYQQETPILDHNSVLRGSKPVDFGFVTAESRKLLKTKTTNLKTKATAERSATGSAAKPKKAHREPIILLSPSPSALLNMGNVKMFLEQGQFQSTAGLGAPNIQYISRTSPRVGALKVVVVNSTDRFKPEYWDRVVAVFVTGQPWQFKQYKWSNANDLFQHVQGFSLVYKGDPVPPTLQQWNVSVVPIDRGQRFRDREVVERIWESIETVLVNRGFRR